VGYKGYCGTLGADYISYMLTDAVVSPPDYAVHFTEKLMYMPLSHYINNYR
jgi:protein O-GlcNAc transferase